jgi:hypothetical protein
MTTPEIPAAWEQTVGLWFKASPGEKSARPYLKKKLGLQTRASIPVAGKAKVEVS